MSDTRMMTSTAPSEQTPGGLDLDVIVPAHLVPSRTEGHQHLYLDTPMNWRTYKRLLEALADVGILETAWVKASLSGQQTLLRPPGSAWDGADPELVFVCNPSHIDIHDRHVMVRQENRTEDDGYSSIAYTVLTPVDDRTRATFVTSTLKAGGHAPALDIDIPATQTNIIMTEDGLASRSRLHFDVTMTPKQRARLLKVMTKTGIIAPQARHA